jgi:hypothetical protein
MPIVLADVGIGSTFFQIGYVVSDAKRALASFAAALGAPGHAYFSPAGLRNHVFEGLPIATVLDIALVYMGDIQVELVQPVSGVGVHFEYLRSHPEGGIHHIGFATHSSRQFASDTDRLIAIGFPRAQYGELSETAQFAYFDARHTVGSYVELVLLDSQLEQLYLATKEGRLSRPIG